ncbi:hypothetical protein KFE25_007016 [Diacronema lutheri]|uniref:Uncharacterized protein n=1 Tax=Diacronema lutheri TaxID=2081491 RepID=A0A8J6CCV6_DIALT|nr:hypothetical protein KFE25_007016 [Diacronema lutheri]
MVAHHKSLAAVRPSIDCWRAHPLPARPKSPRHADGHTAESYKNVARLQRKIEEIHDPERRSRTTQTTNPGSGKLAEQLSRNRQARAHVALGAGEAAHRANLQHMLRRIDNLESAAERKKNPFDTSVYPALLLRRREDMKPAELLDHQLARAAAHAARRPASASASARAHSSSAAAIDARAEAIAEERLRARAQRTDRELVSRLGRAVGTRPSSAADEYDEYSRRVTAAIIAERIYHEDELRAFLRRALDDPKLAHLDPVELRARTVEIAAEFFCRLDDV